MDKTQQQKIDFMSPSSKVPSDAGQQTVDYAISPSVSKTKSRTKMMKEYEFYNENSQSSFLSPPEKSPQAGVYSESRTEIRSERSIPESENP